MLTIGRRAAFCGGPMGGAPLAGHPCHTRDEMASVQCTAAKQCYPLAFMLRLSSEAVMLHSSAEPCKPPTGCCSMMRVLGMEKRRPCVAWEQTITGSQLATD